MAVKKEKIVKVKAKINMKYGDLVVKIGQEFDVKESEIDAVKGLVEILVEEPDEPEENAE